MKIFVNSDLSEFKLAKMICYNVLSNNVDYTTILSDKMDYWGIRPEWIPRHVKSIGREWMMVSDELLNVFTFMKYPFTEQDYKLKKITWSTLKEWNSDNKWEQKIDDAYADQQTITNTIHQVIDIIQKGIHDCDLADEQIQEAAKKIIETEAFEFASKLLELTAMNDAKRKSFNILTKSVEDYCYDLKIGE